MRFPDARFPFTFLAVATGNRALSRISPIGGTIMIAGWLALAASGVGLLPVVIVSGGSSKREL